MRLGVNAENSPIVYCGSGVTACHDLLALEHAGFGGAGFMPGRGRSGAPTLVARSRRAAEDYGAPLQPLSRSAATCFPTSNRRRGETTIRSGAQMLAALPGPALRPCLSLTKELVPIIAIP